MALCIIRFAFKGPQNGVLGVILGVGAKIFGGQSTFVLKIARFQTSLIQI